MLSWRTLRRCSRSGCLCNPHPAILLRDTGATISPFNAFILLQGLETLSLRVERHVENALKVVNFLNNHPKVKKVNHPSLSNHPDHALYQRYFPNGAGSIFTFEVKGGQEEAHRFIDSLEIFLPAYQCGRREIIGDPPSEHYPFAGSMSKN